MTTIIPAARSPRPTSPGPQSPATPPTARRPASTRRSADTPPWSPPSTACSGGCSRLDAGGRPDPAVLVRGAHLARYAHDFRVVRRLIESVPGEHLDAVGALLLGEALHELGDFAAAERILAHGQRLPSSEHVALRLAVTRAKNAQWGPCQPEQALAINGEARAVITAQPLAEELIAALAAVLGPGFDDQTRRAWELAYNLVAETMLEGAASARPIGSGPRS